MTRVALAIAELHQAETDLAGELVAVASRHAADHELFYVGGDLARWSRHHVRRLAEIGRAHDLELDPAPPGDPSVLAAVRRKGAELRSRRDDPSLLILRDLRRLHRMAAGVSLDWEILAQTAQALKDHELLELAQECHPDTLRQLRWTNAALKENAAQSMVSG